MRLSKLAVWGWGGVAFLTTALGWGAEGDGAAPAGHPFACADYAGGRVCLISAKGEVEWDWPAPATADVWVLPSGNVLFSHHDGAMEVTRDKRVVWEYKTAPGGEVYTCQRLPNGDTLVGELEPCRLIEVGPDGQIHKAIAVPTNVAQHARFRNARKLPNGHYLVPCTGEGMVKELDGEGEVVSSLPVPGNPFCAVRLPNGNTLIGCGDGHLLLEVDRAGKTVWQVGENDLPGIPLRFVAGVQRLPNGNTVVCNWLGHGFIGNGTHLFEVTPDKQVVWKVDDHKLFKAIAGVQILDVPGDVINGDVAR